MCASLISLWKERGWRDLAETGWRDSSLPEKLVNVSPIPERVLEEICSFDSRLEVTLPRISYCLLESISLNLIKREASPIEE